MSNSALRSILVAYNEIGETVVLSPGDEQFEIYEVEAMNRSGGAIDMGILKRFSDTTGGWQLGTIDDSATPDFVDVTSTIQGGTAITLFSTTDDDGFLLQSSQRFNFMGFNVSQAEAGSPVYAYSYYDGTDYSKTVTPIATPDYTGTGDEVLLFAMPQDWVAGTTTAVGGDTSLFSLRGRATTAPSTAVQIDDLRVAQLLHFGEAVADNANLKLSMSSPDHILLEGGEGVMPYFATANAANLVRVLYKSR